MTREHTLSCHTGVRMLRCSNIALNDTLLDVQLAAIEVAAASDSSLAAQGLLPSAGRLRFANREFCHSSPFTAQPCEQDADRWSSLVDPQSPSMPPSPRADASSPPCHTADLLSCQAPELMHAAQEPCPSPDTRQRPEQVTVSPEVMANPSSEDALANQMSFEFKDHKHAVHAESNEQRHHSAGSSDLNWELVVQQKQAVEAGRQLQWQLQESQQHLLHCQENHKQRIAAAYGQAVKSEVFDQLCEQQKQAPGAKLAADCYKTSRDSSRAEQQEQQQKQLQLECEAKRAQQRQKAGPEQDASTEAKIEAMCNLGSMYQRADMHSGRLPDFLSRWMILLLLSH